MEKKEGSLHKYPYNVRAEDEHILFLSDIICEQIRKINCRNGQFFLIIKKKLRSRNQEMILSVGILFTVFLSRSMPYKSRAIGVSPIIRLDTEIHPPKHVDRVNFILPKERVTLLMLLDPEIHINSELLKKVTEIRGGDNRLIDLLWLSLFLCAMILYPEEAAAFLQRLGRVNAPGLINNGANNPPGYLNKQSGRITAMRHEDEVGGLTKEEQRALPHPNDMKIVHEGRPELVVGFRQSKFKVGRHGAIHDLPYRVKENGGTKTDKTDENALKMMRSIVDMPNQDKVEWFENGTYQGGTDRGFEVVHIYDPNKKIIAVFKKSTGKFVTTCQLTKKEATELKATGNFGGQTALVSGQVKNLPPQHQTSVNTFESDVMGMTPIDDNSQSNNP